MKVFLILASALGLSSALSVSAPTLANEVVTYNATGDGSAEISWQEVAYLDSTPCDSYECINSDRLLQRFSFTVTLSGSDDWTYAQVVGTPRVDGGDETVVASFEKISQETWVIQDPMLSDYTSFELTADGSTATFSLYMRIPVSSVFTDFFWWGKVYPGLVEGQDENPVYSQGEPIQPEKYIGCDGGWRADYDYATCVITFTGGCVNNEVFPVPDADASNATLVSSQAGFEDFSVAAEYVQHPNLIDEDEEVFILMGSYPVIAGSPKAYTVMSNIVGSFPEGMGDTQSDMTDVVTEDFDAMSYGCSLNLAQYCNSGVYDPTIIFPGQGEDETVSTALVCENVGYTGVNTDFTTVTWPCHGEELVPNAGSDDVMLMFQCPEGVPSIYSNGDVDETGSVKTLMCGAESLAWEQENDNVRWPSACGYLLSGVSADPVSVIIKSGDDVIMTNFFELNDLGENDIQGVGFEFLVGEDQGYNWQQIDVYWNGETADDIVISAYFQDLDTPADIQCFGPLETLCDTDNSRVYETGTSGYGKWMAEFYLSEVSDILAGSFSANVRAQSTPEGSSNTGTSDVQAIYSCVGELWGYELTNEVEDCTITVTAECSYDISPQINATESSLQIVAESLPDMVLASSTIESEEKLDDNGDPSGMYSFKISSTFSYDIDDGSPKDLRVAMKLVDVNGFTQIDDYIDDLEDYNGSDDACVDLVSFCMSGGDAPFIPSLSGVEAYSSINLASFDCDYEPLYNNSVSVSDDETDNDCRNEVRPAEADGELQVSFTCPCAFTWPEGLTDALGDLTKKTVVCAAGEKYWQDAIDDAENVWPDCICSSGDTGDSGAASTTMAFSAVFAVVFAAML